MHNHRWWCDKEDDIKIGNDRIVNHDNSIKKLQEKEIFQEYTGEQLEEILKAFWCMDEYAPIVKDGIVIDGKELLNDLDNVQKQECVKKLNEILSNKESNQEAVDIFSKYPCIEQVIVSEIGDWK